MLISYSCEDDPGQRACSRGAAPSLNQSSLLTAAGLRLFEQQRLDVAKDHGGIEGLVRIDLADKAPLVDQKHFWEMIYDHAARRLAIDGNLLAHVAQHGF